MRKLAIGGAVAAIAVAAAAGGAVAALALDDDELEVQAITVPVSPAASVDGQEASSLVAEDGITAEEARRLASAATEELPGTAISVERDDGLYGVEVRDRVGAIVEVLVDEDGRVVGMDRGDD